MDIKRRLFIGNLPSGVDENLIRNRFSKYGEVLGVELKQRKANDGSQNDEIISTFAFIDISAKKEKLDSCLKKLSRKKWDGQIIKIDFAKESVLSRLERERKELFSESKSNNKEINKGNSSSSTLLNGNSKWYGNSVRNGEKAEEEQKHEYQNNKRKLGIDFQQHNGKVRRFPESTNKNGDGVETNKTSSSSQSFTPEQRRLKSLEEKMKLVSDRKLAVKAALSSVDSGNRRNKIIFKDDDDNNEGDSVSSCIEPESSIHASKEYMTPEIPNLDSSNKEKNNLFDDSDDSDDETPNSRFKIKEHFDGKKGQKLLKLQSKYGNDSRFALDQRFAESSSDEDREEEEEDDEEETTRNETKSDAVDEDGDRMHVDDRDDDEVNRQLEILQNLVGHQIIKPRADDTKPKKQKPGASSRGSQLCVRFDPTIAEHEKFIVKPPPPGTEEETKASKKRKKTKSTEENVEDNDAEADKSEVETNNAVSAIEVSKETYYEVASDLKERLKSSGTGFSLSQLFSSDEKSKSNDENDRLLSSDQSKEKASTAIKPSIGFEKNDDTNYERMASQNKTSGLSNLWKESFFFKDNDDRFQEGADFFMKNNDDSNRNFRDRRQELKLIVKTKLKRVMRKDRMFKKKIGGGFPSKMNKFPKKKVGR